MSDLYCGTAQEGDSYVTHDAPIQMSRACNCFGDYAVSAELPQHYHSRKRIVDGTLSDITVVGRGLMGTALACAIQHAGHGVTVWNRSAAKMQLERTERTSRAAVVSTTSAAMRSNRTSLYENAEIAEFSIGGLRAPEDRSETDRYRFRLMAQNLFDAMWQVHSDAFKTDLSPETWTSQGLAHVKRVLSEPGGRWFWAEFGSYYPNDVRREVDQQIG